MNKNELSLEEKIKADSKQMLENIGYLQKGLKILKGEMIESNKEPICVKCPKCIEEKAKKEIKKKEKEKFNKNIKKSDKVFKKAFKEISPHEKEVMTLKIKITKLKKENKTIKEKLNREMLNSKALKRENEKLMKEIATLKSTQRPKSVNKTRIKKAKSFTSTSIHKTKHNTINHI